MLRLRALVVDDHFLFRELIYKVLHCIGIESIILVPDGTTAIAQIKTSIQHNTPFDLVFLDWVMPGAKGPEIIDLIRDSRRYDRTPVIMISAERSSANVVDAVKRGVSAYLLKPISPTALTDRLLVLLDRIEAGHVFFTPPAGRAASAGADNPEVMPAGRSEGQTS
jgi:DNA-binding response OmpR family regulator